MLKRERKKECDDAESAKSANKANKLNMLLRNKIISMVTIFLFFQCINLCCHIQKKRGITLIPI